MVQPPLEIILEFARAQDAAKRFDYSLSDQEYLLRRGEGDYASGRFPWSSEVLHAVLAFERAQADAQAMKRLGDVLHDFLVSLGWGEIEREIEEALAQKREVHLTVRCSVAELYGVPLDLVTLGKSGATLAALPGCHVRYEWPETHSAEPEVAPLPEGGRIVFAWSAAGGAVPAAQHLQAIDVAVRGCQLFDPGIEAFNPAEDQLRHVSLATLKMRLEAARASQTPIAVLHILCHGGKLPGDTKSYGLLWNSWRRPEEPEWVDPSALERVLHPYAGLVRTVVLCACQGANPGAEDNHLGSVAQALHRIGIPVVMTSRYPLSVDGSNELTERLYQTLLSGEPLHRAVAAARQALATDASNLDWAALQVYSRTEDGTDVYPFTFRPFRGLLTFEARHARFFFGREELTKKLRQRVLDAAEGKLPRFQVVAGISGSGKSSLVKAGLVPMLGKDWDTAELRPSEGAGEPGPLALLVRKLCGVWGEPAGSEPATIEFVLGEAKRLRETRPNRKLLLVVDQFEEVFAALADAPRQEFGQALGKLSSNEALGIVVVATLRVDFFGRAGELRLDASTGLDAIIYDERSREFVRPLQGAELGAAIEGPPGRAGLRVEQGLAERLRDDVGHEPGALPLLEHALDALWREREGMVLTNAAYDELGKASGALSQQLDAFINSLDNPQRKQVRKLLVRLVDFVADTNLYTRRRMPLHELRPSGVEEQGDFDAILEKLVAKRLVVRGGEERICDKPSEGWVEMAHESLIRQWKQLEGWLREDREKEVALRELEKWAKEWDAKRGDRNERDSYLASESRLGYLQNVEQRFGDDFSPLLREFFAKSAQKERRRRRRIRTLVAVLAGSALSVFAFQQRGLKRHLLLSNEWVGARDDALQKVLELKQALVAADPTNAQLKRDLSDSYNRLGDMAMARAYGDLKAARDAFQKGLELRIALVAADPTNAQLKRDLWVSYNELGDVAQAGGDLKAARDAFQKGVELMTALVTADPTNAQLKRDLWVSYNKLGDVAQAGGYLQAARDAFQKGLELMTALVAADPTDAQLQRDLAASYERLGDVAQASRHLKAARKAFQKGLELTTALVAAAPTNAQLKRALAISYERLAMVDLSERSFEKARAEVDLALKLRRPLAESDPTNVEVQLGLVYTEWLAAVVEFKSGAKAAAKPHRDAAQAVLDQLARDERIARLPRFQALQQALAALRL